MSISSVASSVIQLNQPSQVNSREQVEGNKPDGDGDRDDLPQASAVAVSSATSPVTGNIGGNIDVVA